MLIQALKEEFLIENINWTWLNLYKASDTKNFAFIWRPPSNPTTLIWFFFFWQNMLLLSNLSASFKMGHPAFHKSIF